MRHNLGNNYSVKQRITKFFVFVTQFSYVFTNILSVLLDTFSQLIATLQICQNRSDYLISIFGNGGIIDEKCTRVAYGKSKKRKRKTGVKYTGEMYEIRKKMEQIIE